VAFQCFNEIVAHYFYFFVTVREFGWLVSVAKNFFVDEETLGVNNITENIILHFITLRLKYALFYDLNSRQPFMVARQRGRESMVVIRTMQEGSKTLTFIK
jgi:hypothetical protein